MRVFLDANILFSAAKSDGAVRALVRLLLDRGHDCRVDAYVVAEARRNLVRKGRKQSRFSIHCWVICRSRRRWRVGSNRRRWNGSPAKDRPVLAAAIRLGCDALVTGDRKHFGSAYGLRVGGVTIHSPRSLAEAVLA